MAELDQNKANAQTPSKMGENTDMRAQSPSQSPKPAVGAVGPPPHKANLGALIMFTTLIGMGNIQAGFVISGNN